MMQNSDTAEQDIQQQVRAMLNHWHSGEVDEAEAIAVVLSTDAPTRKESWTVLGASHLQRNDHAAALDAFERALELDENNPAYLNNLGSTLLMLDRTDEAFEPLKRSFDIKPDIPETLRNLITYAEKKEDTAAQVEYMEKIIALLPDDIFYRNKIGILLRDMERFDESEEHLRAGLALADEPADQPADQPADAPKAATILYNLACTLKAAGFYGEAMEYLSQLLHDDPDSAPLLTTMANAYRERYLWKESASFYERALAIDPDHHEALNNYAMQHIATGNMKTAEELLKRTLENGGHNDEYLLRLNLSYTLLAQEKYADGWQAYEARRNVERVGSTPLKPPHPSLTHLQPGEKDVDTLFVMSEQGLGDNLQFARFGPALKKLSKQVYLLSEGPLASLLNHAGLYDKVFAPGATIKTDPSLKNRCIPMLSAPLYLEMLSDRMPYSEGYLPITEALTEKWRRHLNNDKFTIGISWQGNLVTEKRGLPGRSFLLEEFKPIAALDNVEFISLQKGEGVSQLVHCTFRDKISLAQEAVDKVMDFMEIGAIAKACDLLIVSDSVNVHLGGAIGIPTWLVLKKGREWRWRASGERSHWYDSVRIFQQKQVGDWKSAFTHVKQVLLETYPQLSS